MRTDARELLAVGICGRGSCVRERIEMLVRRGRAFSTRVSVTRIAAGAVALCGMLLAGSLVPRWIAFAQQDPRPSFEVASIKPASPPTAGHPVLFGMVDDPGRFKASYMSVRDLMAKAFGIGHSRISGGPAWVLYDRFDVVATLPPNTPAGQIPQMLQTLLSERFRLTVRRDSRMTRVYALVPDKGGPKLKASWEANNTSRSKTPELSSAPLIVDANGALGLCCGRGRLNRVSMESFATLLSSETDRPVQDATGIQGSFDISLDWTPEAGSQPEGTASPSGPSIYTAVREQLGLRLEPRIVPLEYLVIDHVEKPSEN
jgi:uncharacterized protein (TIGR03435 family)